LTPAYNSSDNRLNTTWASHDDAGNMLAFKDPIGSGSRDWSAAYDAEYKQTFFCGGTTATCNAGNADAQYIYDGEGNRVQKLTPGVTTHYVYDAFGRLAAEYTTATPTVAPGSYWRTTDHLGSTRLVTDENGDVDDRRDLFPFGEQIADSYSSRSSAGNYNDSNPASRHLFTAKERDEESGLDYFLARYYSGSMGRFTSVDPANAGAASSNPQSWNGYSYTLGNPLAFVDPSGAVTVCATDGDTSFTPSDDPDGFRIVVTATAQAPAGPAEPVQTDSQEASISAMTGQVGATAPLVNTLFAISTSVTGFTGGGTAALSLGLASKGKSASGAFSGVRALSQTLREAGVSRTRRLAVVNSFRTGTIESVTAGSNQTALRYFSGENAVGRFLTPTFPTSGSARSALALPAENFATGLAQFQIRSGAQFFRGTVAPNFGKPGGGVQYYVPNLTDLVRLQ
jgi:RHS repeat-associated protein